MHPTYIYRVAEIVKVHDGDTYQLRLDLGFRVFLTVIVRLHGWNCPELAEDARGHLAQLKAETFLRQGKEIIVQSFKDKMSFERWICDVYVDNVHLGQHLFDLGLASQI
jgi:endonuclease YncB( thermonuclease family)